MQAMEVMTAHPQCVSPTVSLQEAASQMRSLNVGSLPVCENHRLVGLVTDRDITLRAVSKGQDPTKTVVRDVMTPKIVYCFADQEVEEVAQLMRNRQIRRLPVLNRERQLVGIVSLGDLAVETDDERLSGDALKGISEPVEVHQRAQA